MLLGDDLWYDGLKVGADGYNVWVLVHVSGLILLCYSDFFLIVLLDYLKVLVLNVIVLVKLHLEEAFEIYLIVLI